MSAFQKAGMLILALILSPSFMGANGFPQSLPLWTIEKGEFSYHRYGDPEFSGADLVIRDGNTWEWFWESHTSGIWPQPSLPKIDFHRETVLVTLLGYQTSGGGPGIEIQSVESVSPAEGTPFPGRPSGRGILVTVEENREPGPLTVITNPYHIVKIRHGFVSIVFHRGRMGKPCLDNTSCPTGEFCQKKTGQCNEEGVCRVRPDACIEIYAPVCGCDGKTYGNECAAASAGVPVLKSGDCEGARP